MNPSSIKSRLPQLTAVAAVIAVGAIVILLTTSGPPSASEIASSAGSTPGQTVDISNFKFDPPDLTVQAGSKVTFVNEDSAEHTATSDTSGEFDTGDLGQGDKKTVTLSKPGTIMYHCQFHAFMTASITVK